MCQRTASLSQIVEKLAEKNEFATHFLQKHTKMNKNEQSDFLNESSKALRNHSDFEALL